MTCSTCDDYQLVPGGDGMLERCPDCLAASTTVRCPVHGRPVVDGKCPSCGREAALAIEIVSWRGPATHPLAETVA